MTTVQQMERRTLMINGDDLWECAYMEGVIETVEDAFTAYHSGEAQMPAKSYVDLEEYNGDFRSMPAAVNGAAGIKWVNVHPNNPEKFELPTVMGVVIYSDPETAYPLALMDGTSLTRLRTGAAAGVATRYLAPPEANSLGLLGAGQQAHAQLSAISTIADLDRVIISDLDEDAIDRFIEAERERDVSIESGSPEAVASCDVVSTTTPARTPVLKREWIADGTHINAMGADAEGKQELESEILADAKVVIDDWEQCSHSGEINVPVTEGVIESSDVYADLGEVVTGTVPRIDDDDITVFDSTGLAIQDIAVAQVVYESAEEQGLGSEFQLVNA